VVLVEHDEILMFAYFVPSVYVDAYTGVRADTSACAMSFSDISYSGICAEILNLKAQTFIAEEQLASQEIFCWSLLSN
jgi:hypothetical protein